MNLKFIFMLSGDFFSWGEILYGFFKNWFARDKIELIKTILTVNEF